jgi:response regulator RpfG family c-di-GMP phosphodiesterase
MTSAALPLAAPTPAERRLLALAARLTVFVERRVAERAARREIALDLLREQQARKADARAVEHLLALSGLPHR